MIDREPFKTASEIIDYLARNIIEFEACNLSDVNQKSIFGNPPLVVIAGQPTSEETALAEVILLVEAGADVNLSGEMGETALHEAAERGSDAMAKYLVSKGAVGGIRDRFDQTAADLAFERGYPNLGNYLLEHDG